jgi:hypothetical protein
VSEASRRSSEHTPSNVLFTDETETPVNVLTGETPAHSQATVEEAKEFAASIDTETPQIALPASDEFSVDFEAGYESGDLTITVERADEA